MRNFYSTSNQWDLILGADGITVCEQTSQLQFANRSDCDGASFRRATSISQCFVHDVYGVYSEHRCVFACFFLLSACRLPTSAPCQNSPQRRGLGQCDCNTCRLASLGIAFSFLNISTLDPGGMISNCLLIVIDRYWLVLILLLILLALKVLRKQPKLKNQPDSVPDFMNWYMLIHHMHLEGSKTSASQPGPPIMDNEWDKTYMEQLVLELLRYISIVYKDIQRERDIYII